MTNFQRLIEYGFTELEAESLIAEGEAETKLAEIESAETEIKPTG